MPSSQIRGKSGARTVKASDFFQGFYTVDLQPSEIITAVQFAPVQVGGVRQAASARLALRGGRRGGRRSRSRAA